MRVVSAESTELFVGPSDAPLQLVRVAVTGCTEPAPIRIHGDGLAGEAAARPGDDVIEVAVAVESPVVGERRTARVHTPDGPSLAFEFTVAEPARPTASSWCARIWRWRAASPSTSSC